MSLNQFAFVLCILSGSFLSIESKWVEGHLKTSQNWAFLSRFCFLSHEGQFEYQIEYNRDMGIPSLLLYYDDESQWPSVYHSNKTCEQREAILNRLGQNQIIPLSPWYPENEFSGCVMKQIDIDKSTSTTIKPPESDQNRTKTFGVPLNFTGSTEDPRYYDQFLIKTSESEFTDDSLNSTTPYESAETTESQFEVFETLTEPRKIEYNDTDIRANLLDVEILFNSSNWKSQPIKRSVQYDRNRIRKFNPDPPRSSDFNIPRSERRTKIIITCHNMRRFRSVRERWWFIAISNCGEAKGIDVKYRFLMTNGSPGDYWHEHFSADEFYVLPILMAFCFGYVLMVMAIAMCSVELKTRQMLHTTYKLFVLSVSFQESGILLQSLAFAKYAMNGIGADNTKIFGQLLCGISEISYLLLLVLMAKGYTITRARLKVSFTVKLTIFICCYSITYTALFIYQAREFDPGEVLYLYESPPGYGLIVLRICAWFIFVYAIIFTMRKYPEKGVFYFPFSLCGTLWFFAGPLFILTANNYIDKWVRESVVTATLLFITFAGHVTFLLLTLPVFANKNFPYHVRTTQIGVMEVTGMIAGNSTLDNFGHHIYTPHQNTGMAQSVIIPLTRRTEELMSAQNYGASAPPLNALSPYHGRNVVTKNAMINNISSSVPDNFTIKNVGPKLSVSTHYSTESASSDKRNGHDSLENRFVPSEAHDPKDDLNQDTLSILTVDNKNTNEESYKNDEEYINDLNNPFLIGASIRRRNGLLEPIKRDAYNPEPPSWTLVKSQKTEKKTFKSTDAKKSNQNYNLQGVVGTFPLPQIQRKDAVLKYNKEEENEPSTINEQSNVDSLSILYHAGEKLDGTTLAMFEPIKDEPNSPEKTEQN